VQADLLVDDGADEPARDVAPLRRREEVGVGEGRELLLEVGRARRDDVGELVVDEEEDERDGLDRLGEEEAQGRERRLLGGVGGGVVPGPARVGEVGEEVLLPARGGEKNESVSLSRCA